MAPQKGKPLPQILNTPMWSWSLPSAPSHSPTWTYGEPPTPQFHENQPGSQTGMWKLSKIIATKVFKSLLKPDEKTETQGGYMSYPRSHSKPSPDPSKSNQLFFTAVLDQQPRPSLSLGIVRGEHVSSPRPCHQQDAWKFSGACRSLGLPSPPLPSPPFLLLPRLPSLAAKLCRGHEQAWEVGTREAAGCK